MPAIEIVEVIGSAGREAGIVVVSVYEIGDDELAEVGSAGGSASGCTGGLERGDEESDEERDEGEDDEEFYEGECGGGSIF